MSYIRLSYLGVVDVGLRRPLAFASQTELATVLPMDVITCIKSNLKWENKNEF